MILSSGVVNILQTLHTVGGAEIRGRRTCGHTAALVACWLPDVLLAIRT